MCMVDMTHRCVWHDAFFLEHAHSPREKSLFAKVLVTWRFHMDDTTHSCVRHDSSICGACLILLGEYPRGMSLFARVRVTWLLHMWDMTHSYVRHDLSMSRSWQWWVNGWDTVTHCIDGCVTPQRVTNEACPYYAHRMPYFAVLFPRIFPHTSSWMIGCYAEGFRPKP